MLSLVSIALPGGGAILFLPLHLHRMKYIIHHTQPHLRYITVETLFENIDNELIEIQMPAWRPGRYELSNFAKNVRNFVVEDSEGNLLPYMKVNKDLWQVQTLGADAIKITYEYFAATLDAGSTYTDAQLLYVNPVNCLMYETTKLNEECTLQINVDDSFTIACALPKSGKILTAENFDQLADSPFIASPNMQHSSFTLDEATHHIWVNGANTLDIEKFTRLVKQYTQEQVNIFGKFDATEYHYLIHLLPYSHRHGVEHKNSTVIVLGPGEEFNKEEKLNDLLAICSHELFHFWNVKRIRPAAMWPYNFAKENYSVLGYVYEGVTTYYGDYMLLRSGVLTFDAYSVEISKDLQRHFTNDGRYNYSVAESSFDTWLDGYTPGAPARKVSIYVEGMLAALIADVKIRTATKQKNSLDTVMSLLYQRFYLKNKGYTEKDYQEMLEETSGQDMQQYFKEIIWGKGNIEKYLPDTLATLGLQIEQSTSQHVYENVYGFKVIHVEGATIMNNCAPNSPADKMGLALGDVITGVNGKPITAETILDDVINQNSERKLQLTLKSILGERTVNLLADGNTYFSQYKLLKNQDATAEQKQFFEAWSKQAF